MPTSGVYFEGWDVGTADTTTIYYSWPNWAETPATNSTTVSNIWTGWNTGSIVLNSTYTYQTLVQAPVLPVRTAEQVEAQRIEAERRAAAWREQAEREVAEREEARRRARILLEENLSDKQRAQLRDNNWFEVITPKGHYRIRHGRSGNVDKLVGGRIVEKLCIHPTEDVPNEDTMLAQKLLLETDEEAFRRIANITALVV